MSISVATEKTENKRCVRCGKCLATCPLYRVTRREEHSPRGRILLTERTGQPDTIRCFACLKCHDTCPYDLSPLDHPGQTTTLTGVAASLCAFIFHGTPLPPEAAADPVARAWSVARGLSPDDRLLATAERFENGELYHPFLQIEMRKTPGTTEK